MTLTSDDSHLYNILQTYDNNKIKLRYLNKVLKKAIKISNRPVYTVSIFFLSINIWFLTYRYYYYKARAHYHKYRHFYPFKHDIILAKEIIKKMQNGELSFLRMYDCLLNNIHLTIVLKYIVTEIYNDLEYRFIILDMDCNEKQLLHNLIQKICVKITIEKSIDCKYYEDMVIDYLIEKYKIEDKNDFVKLINLFNESSMNELTLKCSDGNKGLMDFLQLD